MTFNTSSSLEHSLSDKPETTEFIEHKAELVFVCFGRTEGVKASGAVFWRARKDWWAPWVVDVASGAYRLSFLVSNIH